MFVVWEIKHEISLAWNLIFEKNSLSSVYGIVETIKCIVSLLRETWSARGFVSSGKERIWSKLVWKTYRRERRERKRRKWGEKEECAKEGWCKTQQVLIDCASWSERDTSNLVVSSGWCNWSLRKPTRELTRNTCLAVLAWTRSFLPPWPVLKRAVENELLRPSKNQARTTPRPLCATSCQFNHFRCRSIADRNEWPISYVQFVAFFLNLGIIGI